MTHGSLFSGIGGFDLAAAWAGWTNVFNCEIDPFCRRVLKYHFPESKQYEDVQTTDFTIWRDCIDVLPIFDTEHGLLPTVVMQGLKVHGKSGSEPLPPALLPTPVASDCGSGRVNKSLSKGATARPTLALAARMGLLSTPTACDAKNNSFPLSHAKRKSGVVHDVMISHPSRTGKGSQLNPRYVAQMMGFPPDWTELPFRHGAKDRSKLTATR